MRAALKSISEAAPHHRGMRSGPAPRFVWERRPGGILVRIDRLVAGSFGGGQSAGEGGMEQSVALVDSSQGAQSTRRDHVALDVTESGRELESLPVGNGERQTSEKPKQAESLAEIQIRGLLWLEEPGNEVYLKAHKTWEAQDALFASRIDKKKKQSNSLRNEIYQLFGFYSVFQGVLLTAVAQSNYLHCHNWWTAFFLSLLASVVTIGGIIQKFRAILALEKTIKNEADTRQECINRVGRLLRKRQEFDFAVDAQDGKPRRFNLTKLRVSVLIVFVCLIFFSVLFLASIYQILCDAGEQSSSS